MRFLYYSTLFLTLLTFSYKVEASSSPFWERTSLFNPDWEKNQTDFAIGHKKREDYKNLINTLPSVEYDSEPISLTSENTLLIFMGEYGRANKNEQIEKPILATPNVRTCCAVLLKDSFSGQVGLAHVSSATNISYELPEMLKAMFPKNFKPSDIDITLVGGNGDLAIRLLNYFDRENFDLSSVKIDLREKYLPKNGEGAHIAYQVQEDKIYLLDAIHKSLKQFPNFNSRIQMSRERIEKDRSAITKLFGVKSRGY